jgi:hypothetical protein
MTSWLVSPRAMSAATARSRIVGMDAGGERRRQRARTSPARTPSPRPPRTHAPQPRPQSSSLHQAPERAAVRSRS